MKNYKIKYPELVACLQKGKQILIDDLKKNINERSLKLLKPIKEINNTKYEYLSIYKSLQSKIAT